MKHSAGKGSRYRPVDKKKYDKNYDDIFGEKKLYEKCIQLYSVGGSSAVVRYCTKLNHKKWGSCYACDDLNVPVGSGNICLICGTVLDSKEIY